jgi:peptidyl-tRNA hydrolase
MGSQETSLKAYILVADDIDLGHAMVAVAHAGSILILSGLEPTGAWKNDEAFVRWYAHSFKKVVCKVTRDQLAAAVRDVEHRVIVTESSLANMMVAAVFKPREHWPEELKRFPLYG